MPLQASAGRTGCSLFLKVSKCRSRFFDGDNGYFSIGASSMGSQCASLRTKVPILMSRLYIY